MIIVHRYTQRTRCCKFYVKGYSGFANAPMDSVVNDKTLDSQLLFAYNSFSGIPPKLNVDFLNRISREAVIIFSADVRFYSDTVVIVDEFIQ